VLKQLETGKASASQRDPDGYFFTVFGEPSANGVWGYRVEGHHVSQNYTVVAGKVIDSPSFFGSNPAESRTARARASAFWRLKRNWPATW